jgi:hypothetical protein
MPVLIRVQMTTDGGAEVSARAHSRAMKSTMEAVGKHWKRHMLGRHFRSGAATKYGYQPRTNAWQRRKLRSSIRASDAHLPLIFTGTLKRMVLRSNIIRAYPTRATVELPGPRYLTARPNPTGRGRSRPWMAAEITAITPDEIRELDRVAEEAYPRFLAREVANKRTRRRITSAGVSG